jgi:type III pantothenate kinase
MNINLCIDWGNTRIKIGIFVDNKLTNTYNVESNQIANALNEIIATHNPTHSILCSVVHISDSIIDTLRTHTKFIALNNDTKLPILNAYHSADSLGNDRIALAVAANHYFPNNNNLVISVGTAITYNYITQTRTFRGGNITPGAYLRLQSLNTHTAKLPFVSIQGETTLLGYDTETNIRSGVVWGIVSELDGMISLYQQQFGDINAILTGGDSTLFANKIKNKTFADLDFLLKGLNIILNYNA